MKPKLLTLFVVLIFFNLLFPIANIAVADPISQTASLETILKIDLPIQINSVAVNAETNRIYVGAFYGTNCSVIVIDGITKQTLATIFLPDSQWPSQIAVDSGNNRIFVLLPNNITVIDGATNSIIGQLPLVYTGWPEDISVDSERNLVYVGIEESIHYNVDDRIQIYDAQTLNLLNYIQIPSSASTSFHEVYVAVNPHVNRIFATWSGNSTIYLFDAATRQLLQTGQYISPNKDILGVDPSTNRIYLTNETLDGNTLTRLPQFNLGYMITKLVFDPNFNLIYGVRDKSNGSLNALTPYELVIVDSLNDQILSTFSMGNGWGYRPEMGVNLKTGEVYLTGYGLNEITVIQGPNTSKPLLATNLSINPSRVPIGQSVTISYSITNLANSSMTYSPAIAVNGSKMQQGQIQIASKETRNLTFTATTNFAGNYTVTAEGLSANFTSYIPTSTVAFRTGGMSSDTGSAPVLTIDSAPYNYTQMQTLSFNWAIGSNHTITASTAVLGGSGKRYTFANWTNGDGFSGSNNIYMVPSSNVTITANWQTQYYLNVSSVYGTAGGTGWYDLGSTAYATLNNGTISGGSGTQYVFNSWGTGASGANYAQSSGIIMSGPKIATSNWQTQYRVTFTVSGVGSTSPNGSNVWENAGSLSILATPNVGYAFSSWSSNTGSITFNNANSSSATATINGTGTITASFAINTYPITVTQTANGQIAPDTSVVNYGATPSFTISPNAGYHIVSITASGSSVAVATPSGQSYQFNTVSAAGSLTATFAINTYLITVTQTANGNINPGTTLVNYGDNSNFIITPSGGCYITSITTDAGAVTVTSPSGQTVTFPNVASAHTITAIYALTPTPTPTSTPTPAVPEFPSLTISFGLLMLSIVVVFIVVSEKKVKLKNRNRAEF